MALGVKDIRFFVEATDFQLERTRSRGGFSVEPLGVLKNSLNCPFFLPHMKALRSL